MPNHPYLGYQLNDIFYYRPYPYGSQGAVSSNSPYATAVGLEILKKGGNVFDAACAVSLTLGLVGPYHSGIGGGCFYIFYHKESNQFYCCDARGVVHSCPRFIPGPGRNPSEIWNHELGRSFRPCYQAG